MLHLIHLCNFFYLFIIFILLDCWYCVQVYVDAVYGHKLATGHANQAWLCLDLLDVFCQLAEMGHAGHVRSLLEYPLKHCPEVLLLGLAQINVCFFFIHFVLILQTCHCLYYLTVDYLVTFPFSM